MQSQLHQTPSRRPCFLPRALLPARGLSIATSLGELKATPTPAPHTGHAVCQLCLSKEPDT